MSGSGLSTQPYKGTRDFYPEEMRLRKWMFNTIRQAIELYGYQEYDGPLLESFDLYAAKTGDEIVNEQLYSFTDRGERKMAIRPEMTPTLARMVAARLPVLTRPIRWYSIPNLWRYERPQKGRLREHWQVNVDLLGVSGLDADLEILQVAVAMMRSFGANQSHFDIQINSRHLVDHVFTTLLKLDDAQKRLVARAIDKKEKISPEAFEKMLTDAGCSADQCQTLHQFLRPVSLTELETVLGENRGLTELKQLFHDLEQLGLKEYCHFNPAIMRGFDYYTGTVFEIFDRNPENRRALFGGGRYDNLVGMFGGEAVSGIGFGMGDVTLKDFLTVHQLIKEEQTSPTQVLVCYFSEETRLAGYNIAESLRQEGIPTETVLNSTKIGKQFQYADKKKIRFVIVLGPDEEAHGLVTLKDLQRGGQETLAQINIVQQIKNNLGLLD